MLALPLRVAPVHGHGETAIALPLDGFELAHAHGDGQSFFVTGSGFGLIGSETAGEIDGLRGDGGE